MKHNSTFVLHLLAGVGICVYTVAVLVYVASSPDIRLRALLTSQQMPEGTPANMDGIEIRKVLVKSALESDVDLEYFGEMPRVGDYLISIADLPTRSFTEYSKALSKLRGMETGDRSLGPNEDPLSVDNLGSSRPLAKIESAVQGMPARKIVRVKFWREGWKTPRSCWLVLHPMPIVEIMVTLAWFALQLAIFAVSLLALWNRPKDKSTRLFYLTCLTTMGAFVGGFHWWVIAGNPWLTIPFVVCATLLPVISLKFFCHYPDTKPIVTRMGVTLNVVLYGLAAVYCLAMIVCIGVAESSYDDNLPSVANQWVGFLRILIYSYLGLAAVLYLASLACLVDSYRHARNVIEQKQISWILWAAVASTILVIYSVFIGIQDPVEFALGQSRIPMFLVSLSFSMAYAIGIARYRLMLVDQLINRGVMYYSVGYGVTIAFSLLIAVGFLVAGNQGVVPPHKSIPIIGLLMLSIAMMLILRDLVLKAIDQRFFSEKYQLGKAINQMNVPVGRLVDRELVAGRMLANCRDVLGVTSARLYLADAKNQMFKLVASQGPVNQPSSFTLDSHLLQSLKQSSSLQWTTPLNRQTQTPVQAFLKEVNAQLVHALDMGDEISAIVVLGGKRTGTSFTAEDVTYLRTMSQMTGVALTCAKIQSNVVIMNEQLERKDRKIENQKQQIAALNQELARLTVTKPAVVIEQGPDFKRSEIVGSSPALVRVLEDARKIALSESTVLIRGESGTGKELLAKTIHENSPRRTGPLVSVHCAALSPTLLESELFGHAKGAYTGAVKDRVGRFEAAQGGTLFLDEIGDITMETQIKLLRVLQERRFEPVGSTKSIEVDVRLVTATHQNLEALIKAGKFREDLFYRLNVISVTMPPLRDRPEDLPELVMHFLQSIAKRRNTPVLNMDDDAFLRLCRHAWPGNIRELENAIERAVVLSDGQSIRSEQFDFLGEPDFDEPQTWSRPSTPALTAATATAPRRLILNEDDATGDRRYTSYSTSTTASETAQLLAALDAAGGNKAQAARLLDMPRSTFYSKLKKHGLD